MPDTLTAAAAMRTMGSSVMVMRATGGLTRGSPDAEVVSVPIPLDCTDGIGEACYGRPECLLDPRARVACSAWSFVGPRFNAQLGGDLRSGAWDAKYGQLRTLPCFEGSLKLIVGQP